MAMRKRADATEFAIYVRNVTAVAVKLEIPLGRVEREPTMSDDKYQSVLARCRALVAQPLHPRGFGTSGRSRRFATASG